MVRRGQNAPGKWLTRREIARRLDLDRRTVSKYFHLNAPPDWGGMVIFASKTAPFQAYLHKRLEEGCRNLKVLYEELQEMGFKFPTSTPDTRTDQVLYEELQEMGFKGSYSSVSRAVHRLGIGNLKQSLPSLPVPPRFSPRQAA